MPELPEVETVVKALRKTLVGRVMKSARFLGKMRVPFQAGSVARAVAGKRVIDVRRRAKYIVIDLDDSLVLLSHLGMTGYFHVEQEDAAFHKHDRAVFVFEGGDELRYADARRFGFVKLTRISGPGQWPEELAGCRAGRRAARQIVRRRVPAG